ncbi:MAG: hypothetical protein NZ811_06240 [Gammaproteobacteria bacterium]|nr:hypothetical protein [Gammaproteobacteria bacterium]
MISLLFNSIAGRLMRDDSLSKENELIKQCNALNAMLIKQCNALNPMEWIKKMDLQQKDRQKRLQQRLWDKFRFIICDSMDLNINSVPSSRLIDINSIPPSPFIDLLVKGRGTEYSVPVLKGHFTDDDEAVFYEYPFKEDLFLF